MNILSAHTMHNEHTTVMLHQAVDALLPPDVPEGEASGGQAGVYVDATFGRGGHSRLILSRINAHSQLIAFDKDPDAVAAAATMTDARFSIRHQGFAHLGDLPVSSVAGVLFDLGVSSPQLDNPARGFGFRADGPLDMRMDSTRGQTVAQWLAHASVDQILEVIHDYGEERFAGPIAKAIVACRQTRGPVESTTELAGLVAAAVKTREPGKHPATRTFQAFRIFINAELTDLQHALKATLRVLRPGGRLVVISFHSLEDRIVKQFIVRHSRTVFDRRLPQTVSQTTVLPLRAVGRHKPCADEIAANPRSRSAIMRVAQRTDAPVQEVQA